MTGDESNRGADELEADEDGIVERTVEAVRESSRKRRLEVFTALLMALATIGTAWAGYQSSRWGSVQTIKFNEGNAARVQSTSLSTRGGQIAQVDVAMYQQAVDAFAAGKNELVDFYLTRTRDEFKPVFEDWIASARDPDAAPTPFALPEYTVSEFNEADALVEEARQAKAVALEANQRSDNYVLAVVVFAAVLFFAGISSRFRNERIRIVMISIATAGFVTNSVWVANFPVTFTI